MSYKYQGASNSLDSIENAYKHNSTLPLISLAVTTVCPMDDWYKTRAPGEARTHNLRMAHSADPYVTTGRYTAYKYGALTDCATGASVHLPAASPFLFMDYQTQYVTILTGYICNHLCHILGTFSKPDVSHLSHTRSTCFQHCLGLRFMSNVGFAKGPYYLFIVALYTHYERRKAYSTYIGHNTHKRYVSGNISWSEKLKFKFHLR